jgi:ferritin-like metal-binding protein YciE
MQAKQRNRFFVPGAKRACRAPRASLQGDRPNAEGKTCDAILGIIEEGKEVMEEYEDTPALDAGLLAAAQAVEHYEISRYGTLRTWAAELGHDDVVKLLEAPSFSPQ